MFHRFNRFVCMAVIMSLVMLNVSVPMAKAAMISTETSISASMNEENRAVVQDFFERSDLRQALESHGIDIDEAQARVDALSDAEVAQLAQQIEDMPAGAGALGAVIGAAVLIFIILLITDIAGATDVFPFVNK